MNRNTPDPRHEADTAHTDKLNRYGLFRDDALEARYVHDNWLSISSRLRLIGGLGGAAFAAASVMDWSILHNTPRFWLLLVLRLCVLATALFLVWRTSPHHSPNNTTAGRLLLFFELTVITVFNIVILINGRPTLYQTFSTVFLEITFYVFAPIFRPSNLWLVPVSAVVRLIELITLTHASMHDLGIYAIFVGLINLLGWNVSIKNNQIQRQSWLNYLRYSQANSFYRAITRIESILLSANSTEHIYNDVAKELQQSGLFSFSAVSVPNAAGRMRYQCAHGVGVQNVFQTEQTQPESAITQYFSEQAFAKNKILVIDDLRAEQTGHQIPQQPLSLAFIALNRLGIQSVGMFPIRRSNTVLALIVLTSSQRHAFDQDMQNLAQQLTELISMAIEKLTLQQRLVQKNRNDVYLAQHDPLTGLANRLALERHVPDALARAKRTGNLVALCMLDLDDFKPINDQFGHEAGDQLLKTLGQRMNDLVRQSDFLARLGGDEFVIVLEDLTQESWLAEMTQTLSRFHAAVEAPFSLGVDQQGEVGMTLGVALFPRDGETADALLRQADATMYQIKQRKLDRTQWWSLGALNGEELRNDESFDAYGTEAMALLSKYHTWVDATIDEFINKLYASTAEHPEINSILQHLNAEELAHLQQEQRRQLASLLSPDTHRAAVIQRALQLGQIHALVGLSTDSLVHLLGEFRTLLQKNIQNTAMIARNKYQLLLAAEDRLQEDMLTQLQSMEMTVSAYHAPISKPLPPAESLWVDVERAELEKLADLPGILDIAVMIPDEHGLFQIANSEPAGLNAKAIRRTTQDMPQPALDPQSPTGNSTVSRAWRNRSIQSTPGYALSPHIAPWRAQFASLGIRSVLAIPIQDRQSRPVAVLRMFGAYPNQFQSPWAQQVALSLRRRWEDIWSRCATPPMQNILPPQLAQAYRKQLFAGGLRMLMQPIVDLQTGQVVKMEALARIAMPDGKLIPPDVFPFLLGDIELDYVFRRALDQALHQLVEWDHNGLTLDIAVNLPPSTLQDPDCHHWIAAALQRYQLAPSRLSLEILESQSLERPSQHKNIRRLVELGVQLSMDDLGTGYSSLQRLAELPFDLIKVDQALLTHIRLDPKNTLIVIRTLLRLGRDLEREVVVEGLEDNCMIEAMMQLGARYGQGYGLARPMPAESVHDWVHAFQFTQTPGEIRTHLGALAYHLQWMEDNGQHTAQHCPITTFLATDPIKNQQAIPWHETVHQSFGTRHASQQFVQWLIENIQHAPKPA